MPPARYRFPHEQLTLGLTLLLLTTVLALTAGLTLCFLPLFLFVFLLVAYRLNRAHHRQLLAGGLRASREQTPELFTLAAECVRRLRPGPVEIFIVPGRQINAYTFGLAQPKVVVLYQQLLKTMEPDELRFVLGHELGHVALGHTWINTLLGGMAGVPASIGAVVIITLAFRWWNRACEYSADRAGLLACGRPEKAISALIKLVAHDADTPAEQQRALLVIEKEDDSAFNRMAETLSTHPMLVRRIEELRRFAASPLYSQLQAEVMRN